MRVSDSAINGDTKFAIHVPASGSHPSVHDPCGLVGAVKPAYNTSNRHERHYISCVWRPFSETVRKLGEAHPRMITKAPGSRRPLHDRDGMLRARIIFHGSCIASQRRIVIRGATT